MLTHNSSTATDTTASEKSLLAFPTVHLTYLDGLRGLAAIFIVLYHVYLEVLSNELPAKLLAVLNFTRLAHYAVSVFIVLSGFLLMLPVVRSATHQVRGGVADYLKRRALRILPA